MKNKILIFICAFALVFSCFSLSCFAFDNDYVGEYVFKEDMTFVQGQYLAIDMYFSCDGIQFWQIEVTAEPGTGGTAPMIIYRDNANNDEYIVYTNGQWVDDSYRYLLFIGGGDLSDNALSFMNNNEYIPPHSDGWYYDIYNMLWDSIYGGDVLNGYEELAISLVSIILCLVAFSIPILVVLVFIKYVLSMRFI